MDEVEMKAFLRRKINEITKPYLDQVPEEERDVAFYAFLDWMIQKIEKEKGIEGVKDLKKDLDKLIDAKVSDLINQMTNEPTGEVIRCCDCVYYNIYRLECNCRGQIIKIAHDEFCSRAKKREH